ncbi:MAG TPA: SH3 domain-containing protein [Coriobacteriia bacterium]
MNGINEAEQPGSGAATLRYVTPWLVLFVLVLVASLIVTGFQSALRRAAIAPPTTGAISATSSAGPTAATIVTDTVAVTRLDGLQLRLTAAAGADVITTFAKGAKLQVLSRTDKWLQVKDPAGRIGWVANSAQSVEIRKQ